MRDTTFIIPFCLDTPSRLTNLDTVLTFLVSRLDTTVIVSEFDHESKLQLDISRPAFGGNVQHQFHRNDDCFFSRSRSINLAAREVETPYLVINDADALVQTWQYEQAITLLRDGCCDMALPFANRVMWVPSEHVADLRREVSDERLDALTYEVSDDAYIFLGLIGLLNTRSFKHAGMMNERFRSWGYEEMEFYMRLLKLGFRVRRTYGRAYHLCHPDGGNSSADHMHFLDNQREYHRVLALDAAELWHDVSTWPWASATRAEAHTHGVHRSDGTLRQISAATAGQ